MTFTANTRSQSARSVSASGVPTGPEMPAQETTRSRPPSAVDGVGDGIPHRLPRRRCRATCRMPRPRAREKGDGIRHGVGIAIEQRHAHAFVGESGGDRPADAACRTGDERRAARESELHRSSLTAGQTPAVP